MRQASAGQGRAGQGTAGQCDKQGQSRAGQGTFMGQAGQGLNHVPSRARAESCSKQGRAGQGRSAEQLT